MDTLHETFVRHRFYPLAASSALALGLLAGRVILSRDRVSLSFLAWNLTLAWIPWLCSTGATLVRRGRLVVLLGAVWLLFLPNAPYVVIDFLHLRPRPPIPRWYDAALIAAFAWAACLLALVSLRTMHALVAARYGARIGWLFAVAAAGLSGAGIYVGRFLRWNSWDLAFHPTEVVADLARHATAPGLHLRPVGVTVAYAGLFLATYLVFGGTGPADREPRR